MNCDVPNDASLAAVLVFGLFASILSVIAEKTHFFPRAARWIQTGPVVRTALVVLLFAIGPITARTKNGQLSLPRPPLLLQVDEPPPEPAIAPVSVHTNGVAFRAESMNAVEITAFRTVGGTELGDWIEVAEPFFAIGTNPVSRCYVSASGSISFNSMRRPPIGIPLPDLWVPPSERGVAQSAGGSSSYSVLCPLRAPLGMVPEANWASAGAESRFWHDSLPGGGRVLTWENALVDRLPGRRVSLQVEMRPSGDSVFRYAFHDELDPPATNFVMEAQMGANGVNALSILGTNTLAATIWTMDGAPVTNGVSIADLLCTNGVLRTPATFEIRWKNTTGLDPDADADGDGLTDWAEIFLWGTYPDYADTDADGIPDNVELMAGADPLDADEDGDGIPDGLSPDAYAANPLWAESAEDANLAIVLQSVIPSGASATLVVGGLALPLRNPATYSLALPPGEYVPFRLLSRDAGTVDLAFGDPPPAPMMRGGGNASRDLPVWARDPMGVFKGAAEAGSGALAIPVVHLRDRRGQETEVSECVHDTDYFVTRFYDFCAEPLQMGLTTCDLSLEGFVAEGPLTLSLSFDGWYPAEVSGWASILPSRLCRGTAGAERSIHRCAGAENYHDCDPCGFAHSGQEPCPEEYGCEEEEPPSGGGSSGGGQGGQNPPEYSCSFMLHVAWQDMDGNGVADKDDGYLAPGSETIEFTAIGSTAGECCCGLDTGPESLTARLVSHSSNLRLWDASGALLETGDSLRTFRIQATAPSPSLGGSTVRYEIVGPTNDVRSAMTIRVTAWDMWCTGLAFNHDTTTNSVDAINLRRNFNASISLPEWTSSANHSASPSRSEPACWIAGTTPTVKGSFVVRPTDITNAVIGAWHLGPILSSAAATSVVFSNGVTHASGATNHADFATFPLSSPIPAEVSRSTDECWGWYATELNGQPASGFIGITVPSVAYSILGAPVAPWVDGFLTNQNVWASALDFVITNACEGATTETNALAKLTQFLFSDHDAHYETNRGRTAYRPLISMIPERYAFEYSSYLGKMRGNVVNCYDQAGALCLSGNLLGISCEMLFMQPFGYIEQTSLVGIGSCNNPFYSNSSFDSRPICPINESRRSAFGNHMFVRYSSHIFDACAGPVLGQWSLSEYVQNVIDTTTTNTLFQTGIASDASPFLNLSEIR